MPARNKTQGKVLVGVIAPRTRPSYIEGRELIELRYAVTPELDGQHLQYRTRAFGGPWGEWRAVKTVFVSKIDIIKPKVK